MNQLCVKPIILSALLFLLLLQSNVNGQNQDGGSNSETQAPSSAINTALFITIPLFGHVNPLISQALELQRRGWNVYIVSCSNIKDYVEKRGVELIDIGHCPWVDEFDIVQQKANAMQTFTDDFEVVVKWAIDAYPHMYAASMKTLREKQLNVTIAIVDMGTFAGTDICDTLNIPYIINNADLLPILEGFVLKPVDHNSTSFMNSIYTLATNTLVRALRPLADRILRLKFQSKFDSRWNKHRANVGITIPSSLFRRYSRHIVLSNSVFGLERVRTIPTHIQLTGPMFDINISKDAYVNDLSMEDRRFLEKDNEKAVIYVSAGTLASLSKEQVHKFIDALSSDRYRVIWKLSKKDAHHLSGKHIPESVRIVDWVSSSLGHLAHPNVKAFISHCGINSVYESIWLDTPIICLPMFFDQYEMGHQVRDAGVGILMDKFKFTSEELKAKIKEILENKNYSHNIKRVQASIKLHGGVKRAADIIELVNQFGSDMFISRNIYSPFYVKYNVDIYLLWFAVFIALKTLIEYLIWRTVQRQAEFNKKNK